MKNLLPLVRKLLTAVPVAGLLLAVAVRHGHRTVNAPATGAETAQSGPRPMLGRHGGRLASPFAPWEGTGRPNAAAVDTAGLKQGAWYKTVVADIERKSYYMAAAEKGGASSTNHAQGLSASYTADGFTLSPLETPQADNIPGHAQKDTNKGGWQFGLHIDGLYSDGRLACAPKTGAAQDLREGEADFHVSDLLTVQYRNTAAGVRQNFVVEKSPGAGTKELRVSMQVPKGWTVGGGGGELRFAKQNGKRLDTKIVYRDLKVWDAGNRPLVATMGTDGRGGVDIKVDAEGARYPVTIDPVSTTATTTLTDASASELGILVSPAGDVNGDGYGDIMVGAYNAVDIYMGSSTGVSTTSSVTLTPPTDEDGPYGFGYNAVCTAGDVNGDGYSDVVVLTQRNNNGSVPLGIVNVYMGSASGLSNTPGQALVLPIPVNNTSFRLKGACSIGDANGDGYSDIMVNCDEEYIGMSEIYVYMGGASGLSGTPVTLSDPSGGTDNDIFGFSASAAGDLNGDGYSDIVVGSLDGGDGQDGNTSYIYVYYGSSSGLQNTPTKIVGSNPGSEFVYAISSAGDVDGDGYADIMVGAPHSQPQSDGSYNGAVYVYKGSSGGLTTAPALTLNAVETGRQFGGDGLTTVGDVNGDGYSDVTVSVGQNSNNLGVVYLYLGSAAGLPAAPSATFGPGNSDSFGYAAGGYQPAIAPAGDVNGDGISDLIIGDASVNSYAGAAYVYLGSTGGISTTAIASVTGPSGSSSVGYSISSAGDVNGDGYGDLVVGDYGAGSGGLAYIYMGSSTGLSASPAVTLTGVYASGRFGISVASAGDVNGDGYGDVVVGAIRVGTTGTNAGAAYVFLGSSTGLSSSAATVLNGTAGSQFGSGVASADVNGDGYSDVIVGAVSSNTAYVYMGSSLGLSSTVAKTLTGTAGTGFGGKVAFAGDVNGDGYGDVVVGASNSSTAGAVYVYHGSSTGLSTTAAATLTGPAVNSLFGNGVACAGDVNGDGYSDLVVGAQGVSSGSGPSTGAAYIYMGSSTGLSATAAVTLNGAVSGDYFGGSVAAVGDLNGDGYSDVVIGGPRNNPAIGAAYVYFGSAGGLSATSDSILAGTTAGDHFGFAVSSAGDVNGDGYSDLIIGAYSINAFFLYAGNGSGSSPSYSKRNNILRLYNTDLSSPLGHSNASATQFGVGLFVRPFPGATRARIVWETEPAGTGFRHNSPITNYAGYTAGQSSYTAIPAAGTELKSLVSKASGKATKVRVRLQYLSTQLPGGQTFGPWLYPQQSVSNGSGIVLPITLLSFNAVASGSGNLVAWQVAEEGPSTFYDVQRSADGVSFSKIGSSVTGKGSNSSYTFHDGSPLSPVSYYRLKGTEADGHVTYSGIAAVRRDGAAVTVSASPNPFTGSVTVTNGDADLNGRAASVVDMLGRTVATFTMSAQTVLDTKGWPAGMYVLRLPDGSTKKVVKR